ncbi:hypothetical protein ACJX0J_017460, partial [Zea mays]
MKKQPFNWGGGGGVLLFIYCEQIKNPKKKTEHNSMWQIHFRFRFCFLFYLAVHLGNVGILIDLMKFIIFASFIFVNLFMLCEGSLFEKEREDKYNL